MKVAVYLFRRFYTTWSVTWFLFPFAMAYPLFRVFLRKPEWYRHAHSLNRFWSSMALRMFLVPVKVIWKFKHNRNQKYIFCPNHSSYIDIPLMLHAVPGFLNFVGKSSLCKVPLWGPIYEKLYISVDRKNKLSSAKSYISSVRSLDAGRSLVIFPEGTIADTAGVKMLEFKDGPFKLAIEKQVPIVPVSMPYNHLFLPDLDGKLKVRWSRLEIVLHEPIDTTGMTVDDIPFLKQKVYDIIESEFIHNRHDNRYTYAPQAGTLGKAGV
ncbi:MAG: 1-acyl-sn-glycerol-3-phosphate acyltransferase [Hymenobacteraceae bacterium]|nr:1-acyl-sn-glycerol-3-phosphate acyltransferase [Hymenobacteraceae bacterium]MDX5395425.1 1-acyl-sn-glycerol-3-phosphate acyltransferase [Hymenobacteraceae bacterium]MDX5443160.1 1-acyl-sn-glycerol-3-phosphate acyltransferase [Hymenobacteraceae bacterium]MDX5511474.1 1-acyl-sn-glycerol-3-phosphate acyltransferase [Hymenobacteraceae bacterium]